MLTEQSLYPRAWRSRTCAAGVGALFLLGWSASQAASPAIAPDPEAATLLQEARANREVFSQDFSGFQAALVVNADGVEHRGAVLFRPPITLEVEVADAEIRKVVKRSLRSMLSHRMGSGSDAEEVVQLGEQDGHPFGRRVFLNDKYESSYRIRDARIMVVDRRMDEERLLIHVLETEQTEHGRYLPTSFFVTTFDRESGAVRSAQAFEDEFERFGQDYLPVSRQIVRTADGGTAVLTLRLVDVRLLAPAEDGR